MSKREKLYSILDGMGEQGESVKELVKSVLSESDSEAKAKNEKITQYKTDLEARDETITALKGDMEKQGVQMSENSKTLEDRIAELEKINQTAREELEKEKESKKRDGMMNYFVEGLTKSFGIENAKDKVGSLMFSQSLTFGENGEYMYKDKTGDEAINAIITENQHMVRGVDGTGTTSTIGEIINTGAVKLEDRTARENFRSALS